MALETSRTHSLHKPDTSIQKLDGNWNDYSMCTEQWGRAGRIVRGENQEPLMFGWRLFFVGYNPFSNGCVREKFAEHALQLVQFQGLHHFILQTSRSRRFTISKGKYKKKLMAESKRFNIPVIPVPFYIAIGLVNGKMLSGQRKSIKTNNPGASQEKRMAGKRDTGRRGETKSLRRARTKEKVKKTGG